jgi:LacI family transcriptional regulator
LTDYSGARRRITLRDVADRAGVHASTVSRALNPDTSSMVKPNVARRVTEAAQQLGYRPNPIASSLRTNRTLTVGIVIPDITNPLFPPIIRGIEDTLAPAGYTAIIANTDNDPDRERLTVERMRERRVDGLILATARRKDDLIDTCRREDIPLVLINRTIDGDGVASVVNDEALGMKLVVDHMLALGHSKIAYVGGPKHLSTGYLRNRGFRRAMRRAGITPDPDLIALTENFREAPGRLACTDLLSRGKNFTAIIAANDLLALGCLDALAEAGLHCPDDISLSGFNDMPFLDRVTPPLTTVKISHYHMGTRAAETILDLAKQAEVPVQRLLLEPQLVVRASTTPPT